MNKIKPCVCAERELDVTKEFHKYIKCGFIVIFASTLIHRSIGASDRLHNRFRASICAPISTAHNETFHGYQIWRKTTTVTKIENRNNYGLSLIYQYRFPNKSVGWAKQKSWIHRKRRKMLRASDKSDLLKADSVLYANASAQQKINIANGTRFV